METNSLGAKYEALLSSFVADLTRCLGENMVSVILYGSAARPEYAGRSSNINILAVVKNDDLALLRATSAVLGRHAYRRIRAVFLSEDYIRASLDTFPIEFLDMQENYRLVYGHDILAGLTVEKKNLRFQCEYELKSGLIRLKHEYLVSFKSKHALQALLSRIFTSAIHLSRNVLRLLGETPVSGQSELIKQLSMKLAINAQAWQQMHDLKIGRIKIGLGELDALVAALAEDLHRIVQAVDAS